MPTVVLVDTSRAILPCGGTCRRTAECQLPATTLIIAVSLACGICITKETNYEINWAILG